MVCSGKHCTAFICIDHISGSARRDVFPKKCHVHYGWRCSLPLPPQQKKIVLIYFDTITNVIAFEWVTLTAAAALIMWEWRSVHLFWVQYTHRSFVHWHSYSKLIENNANMETKKKLKKNKRKKMKYYRNCDDKEEKKKKKKLYIIMRPHINAIFRNRYRYCAKYIIKY